MHSLELNSLHAATVKAQSKHRMKRTSQAAQLSVTGHFGIKTLWDTSAPISRHFDTSDAVIEEKPGHFDPGQFR